MKYTANYNLKKPEESDVVDIDILNDNADAVDSTLKKIDDKSSNITAGNIKLSDGSTVEERFVEVEDLANEAGQLAGQAKADLDNYKTSNTNELNKKLNKAGDTATGIIKAYPNTSHTVAQVRNIILSPNDAIASSMQEGEIWIKYK